MANETLRWIELVHVLPGRLRVRLPWLRDVPSEATSLSDRLSELPGLISLEVRPLTGSVLCSFRPERVEPAQIIDELRHLTGTEHVYRPGEPVPELEEIRHRRNGARRLVSAVFDVFRGIDEDIVTFTEGDLDLASVVSGAFLVGAAAEVAITGKLPIPSWHDLAWKAFRTFTVFEQERGWTPQDGSNGQHQRP